VINKGIIMNRNQKSKAVWTHELDNTKTFAEQANHDKIDYKYVANEVLTGIIFVAAVLAALFLTGCSTPGTVYSQAPTQQLILDKQVAGLSRIEIINGVTECESAGLRAHVITTKRSINGFTSDIPVEVTCMPKHRY
jgi:hypothetical protein